MNIKTSDHGLLKRLSPFGTMLIDRFKMKSSLVSFDGYKIFVYQQSNEGMQSLKSIYITLT